MKSVYWRPQKPSRQALLGISLVAAIGLVVVERAPIRTSVAQLDTKWQAARSSAEMMLALKLERQRRGIKIESLFDPAESGLIGHPMTLVTSRPASLTAKQTSVNPNFAAAIVEMLDQAGVKPGDTVAVGWTGSFPAFNASLAAAIQAMSLRPIVIASGTSSQYGANHPDFLWVDMENHLRQIGLMTFGSSAASRGGGADRGLGMPPDAHLALDDAFQRNQLPLLESDRLARSLDSRMRLYDRRADGQSINAYINVGGGIASTGGTAGKRHFRPGLNRRLSRQAKAVDCVMSRFAKRDCPVIHLGEAEQLAECYGLPIGPTSVSDLGVGKTFQPGTHNRWAAVAVLLGVLITLRFIVLRSWRILLADFSNRWLKRLQFNRLRIMQEANTDPQLMA